MLRLFVLLTLVFSSFALDSTALASDSSGETDKTFERKRVQRLMKRHGLDPNDPNAVRETRIKSAIYTRTAGRALIGLGSGFIVGGSVIVTGGFIIMGEGGLSGVTLGGLTVLTGLAVQIVGIGNLIPGLAIRRSGRNQLRKLGLDPNIKRKAALELVAIQPIVHPNLKGVGFAFAF